MSDTPPPPPPTIEQFRNVWRPLRNVVDDLPKNSQGDVARDLVEKLSDAAKRSIESAPVSKPIVDPCDPRP